MTPSGFARGSRWSFALIALSAALLAREVRSQEASPTVSYCVTYTVYSISNTETSAAGSLDSAVVGSPAGCQRPWTATSNNPSWLSVTPTSGNAAGTLHVSWTANTGAQRVGTVTFLCEYCSPPVDITVTQAAWDGTTCSSFAISPASASPSAAAGSQSVAITGSPSGCTGGSWTTSSSAAWLTVSPGSGFGPGTTTVSWTQNTGSARSATATIAGKTFTVSQAAASACTPDATSLCLYGNRFRVTAQYTDYGHHTGNGTAVPLTSDTGYFWFFSSANVEGVIKMVNFCAGSTPSMAVYATGLTDVGVNFVVTDTATGSSKTYTNTLGTPFHLIQDAAFTCPSGLLDPGRDDEISMEAPAVVEYATTPVATCTADATHLCLYNHRFRVSATYKDYGNHTGSGTAVALTSDTGYFWFFNSANVEVVAKLVSFCGAGGNNRYGVYANGLTDVEVNLTVTDTQNGQTTTYKNALGHGFVLIQDAAFPCP